MLSSSGEISSGHNKNNRSWEAIVRQFAQFLSAELHEASVARMSQRVGAKPVGRVGLLRNPSKGRDCHDGFRFALPILQATTPAFHPPVKIARAAAPAGHVRIGVDELLSGELVDDASLRLAFPVRE